MATYQVDPSHSSVEFAVKHMMFSTVKGRFSDVKGQIEFDSVNPHLSSVVAEASTATVDTRDSNRDAHLRSPDFFDAETYPTISFKSRRIEPGRDQTQARVIGDLTIRDVTREVAFDVTHLGEGVDPWGGTRVGFNAVTTINRKDFGLHWNAPLEAGGVLVGDSVKIEIDIEAVKQS